MLTPFIEVSNMVGGGSAGATPDDLPAQMSGQLRLSTWAF